MSRFLCSLGTFSKLKKYYQPDLCCFFSLTLDIVVVVFQIIIIIKRPYSWDLTCIYNIYWYPFDTQISTVEIVIEGSSWKSVRLLSKTIDYLGPMELSQSFLSKQQSIMMMMGRNNTWQIFWAPYRPCMFQLSYSMWSVFPHPFLMISFFRPLWPLTVNLTAMLVLTTMFISTSSSLIIGPSKVRATSGVT